jgi:hypothetical protein
MLWIQPQLIKQFALFAGISVVLDASQVRLEIHATNSNNFFVHSLRFFFFFTFKINHESLINYLQYKHRGFISQSPNSKLIQDSNIVRP